MRWLTYLLLLIPALGFTFVNYNINEATREIRDDVEATKLAINQSSEELRRLRTEWSYLSQPNRIACLANLYFNELKLVPATTNVYSSLDALPEFQDRHRSIQSMTASLGGAGELPVYYSTVSSPVLTHESPEAPRLNLQHDCN